ncbi:hypothetical protein GCM10010411_76200 [Actinomadura fulvescens]|uniref:Uncharacterized protein n=1 Tax=Actinomadura fulvescens TaxID=46160 RepID=A0ABN3QJD0_9ACTN
MIKVSIRRRRSTVGLRPPESHLGSLLVTAPPVRPFKVVQPPPSSYLKLPAFPTHLRAAARPWWETALLVTARVMLWALVVVGVVGVIVVLVAARAMLAIMSSRGPQR